MYFMLRMIFSEWYREFIGEVRKVLEYLDIRYSILSVLGKLNIVC